MAQEENKIFIASDHAGFALKKFILSKFDLVDLGPNSESISVDYNDYATLTVTKVLQHNSRGILICKTGIGMSIAANRHKGIRAALCYDVESARLTREHNNANILVLSSVVEKPLEIVYNFLNTNFSNEERHIKRIEKLDT